MLPKFPIQWEADSIRCQKTEESEDAIIYIPGFWRKDDTEEPRKQNFTKSGSFRNQKSKYRTVRRVPGFTEQKKGGRRLREPGSGREGENTDDQFGMIAL